MVGSPRAVTPSSSDDYVAVSPLPNHKEAELRKRARDFIERPQVFIDSAKRGPFQQAIRDAKSAWEDPSPDAINKIRSAWQKMEELGQLYLFCSEDDRVKFRQILKEESLDSIQQYNQFRHFLTRRLKDSPLAKWHYKLTVALFCDQEKDALKEAALDIMYFALKNSLQEPQQLEKYQISKEDDITLPKMGAVWMDLAPRRHPENLIEQFLLDLSPEGFWQIRDHLEEPGADHSLIFFDAFFHFTGFLQSPGEVFTLRELKNWILEQR